MSPLAPLHVPSLKFACVQRLEGLILSGEWQIGMRLPSERDLAQTLQVSRPVLHEALVDLANKGLVTITPRRGIHVNDYRTNGSLSLLSSLLAYHEGQLSPDFTRSLLEMRLLMECACAEQAAARHSAADLAGLQALLEREALTPPDDIATLTELDFGFHLHLALSTGNLIYPLIINSFKELYTNLTGQFFQRWAGSPVIADVHAFHTRIVQAIAAGHGPTAHQQMAAMLQHGERYLQGG